MRRAIAGLVAAPLVLAACGSSGNASMSRDVSAQLQADVLAVTKAASAKDWTAARTAVAALRADLAAFRANNRISTARAAQLDATIAQVSKDLPVVPAATTAPTSSAPRTTSVPAPQPKAPAPKPPRHKHGGDD